MSHYSKIRTISSLYLFPYRWIMLIICIAILTGYIFTLATGTSIPYVFHHVTNHIVLLAGEVPPWTPGPLK